MNRRIRKKREKQQLARAIRELVALAEKRQQKRQEAIDAANGWDLDSQLSQAMDALQCPDPDMPVNVLSGGERLQNAGSSHADAYHRSCRRACGMGYRAAFGELSKRRRTPAGTSSRSH